MTSIKKTKRFEEMIAEDARRIVAEWLEIGLEEAQTMLAMAEEATTNKTELPEPAQMAKAVLRSYMPIADVEIAWPIMLQKIRQQLNLVLFLQRGL